VSPCERRRGEDAALLARNASARLTARPIKVKFPSSSCERRSSQGSSRHSSTHRGPAGLLQAADQRVPAVVPPQGDRARLLIGREPQGNRRNRGGAAESRATSGSRDMFSYRPPTNGRRAHPYRHFKIAPTSTAPQVAGGQKPRLAGLPRMPQDGARQSASTPSRPIQPAPSSVNSKHVTATSEFSASSEGRHGAQGWALH